MRTALRQYDRRHGYRGPEATLNLTRKTDADLDDYLDGVTRIPDLEAGLVMRVTASGAEVYLGQGRRIQLDRSQMSWAQGFRNSARWRGPRRRSGDVVAVGDLIRLRHAKEDAGKWSLTQIPAVGGALVSLDPHDGAVRALVGGFSFNDSKFNRAVDMRRQPGSSFKPFVYAAALNKGWTPASILNDVSVKLSGTERWSPKNSDHKELGPIPMRKALALSRNLASINLLKSVGIEDAQTYIRRFGFDSEALPFGLSMVLGTGQLSPVKLAEGYAVFANGGYHVIPYFIQRIEDADGNLLFESKPAKSCVDCWFKTEGQSAKTQGVQPQTPAELVIDPRTAYQMTSLLRGVVERGTGTRAKKLGRSDIVGKTGTTNDVRDSWFAGYQAGFVTIAWMGFDDFGKLGRGEEGGKAALGMWVDFMEDALKDQPIAKLDPPQGLVQVRVDPSSGTETNSKSGELELVQEESRATLVGPEPIKAGGPTKTSGQSVKKKTVATVKRSAPRVMDDLF